MNTIPEFDIKEYLKKEYPLVYKSVEGIRDGIHKLDQAIDHFYFSVTRLIKPDSKTITIGRFVAEMAKAICYTFEEELVDDDVYFVLTFTNLDQINVASGCFVRPIERAYFVYNNARQLVTLLPSREYIYKHESSLRYMLNFIDTIRNNFHITPIKPMEIEAPIKMNIKTNEEIMKAVMELCEEKELIDNGYQQETPQT